VSIIEEISQEAYNQRELWAHHRICDAYKGRQLWMMARTTVCPRERQSGGSQRNKAMCIIIQLEIEIIQDQ
jgi:hypothetical protein